MRSIEIDFDVHKKIELERRGFHETPNEVLRRLLGLVQKAPPSGASVEKNDASSSFTPIARGWSGKGVWLIEGTKVRMDYNGRTYNGEIQDGRWLVAGKTFTSPSAAAGGVAITKAGKHPQLDGWNYWKVQFPNDDKWIPLAELRDGLK